MKKMRFVFRPAKTEELDLFDVDDGLNNSWKVKAHNLQKRRWRKLQDELA